MVDYFLHASSETSAMAAFGAMGLTDAEGTLREQGTLQDGTQWAMDVIGGFGGGAPEGFYVALRWNGAAVTPPVPPGMSIVWSSDRDEPAPPWWTRRFA